MELALHVNTVIIFSKKNGIKMRCDFGELNECIPEFEEYLEEIERKRRLA